MGLRRGVQPVDRVGGDLHRGVKAEGALGETDVVVDRLGHADDRHPHLGKLVGTRETALATDHHEPADAMTLQRGPYPLDAVVEHERGVAARADDGAAPRENAPAALDREFLERLLDQPHIPVVETERAPAELALRLADDATDDGVETRAVAATGQHADRFDIGGGHPSDAIVAAHGNRDQH